MKAPVFSGKVVLPEGASFCSRLSYLVFAVQIIAFWLCVSSASASSLIYNWDPNTEADLVGYKVSYGFARATYTASIDTGMETSFTLKGLKSGQTVYFVVQARKSAGISSQPSEELVVRVGGGVIPEAKQPGPAFSVRSCADWNTMLSNKKTNKLLRNVFELRNTSLSVVDTLRVQVLASNGAVLKTEALRLAPLQQFDYLLNGKIPDQQVGSVCVDHSGVLDGTMVYYYEDQDRRARKRYQFTLAMPLSDGKIGEQAVTFNTFQPSLLATQQKFNVANWLTIRNSDAQPVSGKVSVFDSAGKNIGKIPVVLAAGQRSDIDLHHFGANIWGSAVWTPDQSTVRTSIRNTRYIYDNAAWQPSFLSAVTLEGQSASDERQSAVVHTLGKRSVVEISNVLPMQNPIAVQVFRADGVSLSTFQLTLAPSETRHIVMESVIGTNTVGQVVLRDTLGGGMLVYNLEYGYRPTGEVGLISGLPAVSPEGLDLRADYDTNSKQQNRAFFSNSSDAPAAVSIALTGAKGKPVKGASQTFVLPAHGSQSVDLANLFRGSGSGVLVVHSPTPDAIVGMLERNKPGDYAVAFPIREGRG